MVCSECSRKEDCIFFHFVVEHGEFGAYLVHVDDPAEWHGSMEPGTEHGLDLRLVGQRAGLIERIAECIKRKPLISLDAAGDKMIRFELVSCEDKYGGREIGVKEIIEDYNRRGLWDGSAVSGLRIEFVTPVEIRKKRKIIDNPEDMTFDVFLGALLERIKGLATAHCGFEGKIPSFEDIASPDKQILTDYKSLVFVSRKPGRKGCPAEKKGKEYFGGLKGTLFFKLTFLTLFCTPGSFFRTAFFNPPVFLIGVWFYKPRKIDSQCHQKGSLI